MRRDYFSGPLPFAVLLISLAASGEAQERSDVRCVQFESNGRLHHGTSFRRSIGHGLEFRLRANDDGGPAQWHIDVGPEGELQDYLWLVSPPLQTAPHRSIGAVYGSTARQSATLTPRRFRFVLSRAEYDHVRQLIESARADPLSKLTAADLERMGRGTLLLEITGFDLTPDGAALQWIEFSGRACVPKALAP